MVMVYVLLTHLAMGLFLLKKIANFPKCMVKLIVMVFILMIWFPNNLYKDSRYLGQR